MRNMLAFLGFVLFAFLGIGWYLGWYQISSQPSVEDGHQKWSIDVNGKKVSTDLSKGVQAVQDRIKGKATDTPAKAPSDQLPVMPPPPLNANGTRPGNGW